MATTTYRFRFLIYFAAFMLIMSVCFVYAEPAPAGDHFLFQTAPQHAGFLSNSAGEPHFDPADLRAATIPVITPAMLQQLQDVTHAHHSLFHRRSHHTMLRSVSANMLDQSSVLNLTAVQPASWTSAR